MTSRPSFDATIPTLTEVFQDPPAKAEAEAGAMAAGTDLAMAALEQRLCERIVQQLQGRVDALLEQRLRDSMEQALQHALQHVMAGLSDAIRANLQQGIEDIVARAVAQELAPLHTLKK